MDYRNISVYQPWIWCIDWEISKKFITFYFEWGKLEWHDLSKLFFISSNWFFVDFICISLIYMFIFIYIIFINKFSMGENVIDNFRHSFYKKIHYGKMYWYMLEEINMNKIANLCHLRWIWLNIFSIDRFVLLIIQWLEIDH